MGPELISVTLADPAGTQPLLDFINHATDAEPFRLKFNRSYSEFDMFVFRSLAGVREQTAQRLKEYNEERPP